MGSKLGKARICSQSWICNSRRSPLFSKRIREFEDLQSAGSERPLRGFCWVNADSFGLTVVIINNRADDFESSALFVSPDRDV